MISVNIELQEETKSYDFPTSWDEVSVEQFMKLFENDKPIVNELMGSVRVVSILSGIDEEIIMAMDIEDFKKLSTSLNFIGQEISTPEIDFIEIDGEKYYLYKDFNKMTTGEIITIELLMENNGGNIYSVMPELLCVFLRKKNENGVFEKFNTEMMSRKDKFKKVSIDKIHHIFSFFLTGGTIFNPNIQDFIPKENL